jgi:acetolactate synthase-1/2/3 large subunit
MDMLSLADPDLDWISLAKGMGVEAVRVETIEALIDAFRAGLKRTTPFLIEVVI